MSLAGTGGAEALWVRQRPRLLVAPTRCAAGSTIRAIRFSPVTDALFAQLVGDEAVTKGGIFDVSVVGGAVRCASSMFPWLTGCLHQA